LHTFSTTERVETANSNIAIVSKFIKDKIEYIVNECLVFEEPPSIYPETAYSKRPLFIFSYLQM